MTPDQIRPGEFVPVKQVGQMESQFPGLSMDEAYGAHELRFDEAADDRCRFLGYQDAWQYQAALNEHIGQAGIQNPVSIGRPTTGSGSTRASSTASTATSPPGTWA